MTAQSHIDQTIVTRIRQGKMKNGFQYDNRVFFSHQEVLCYQYLRSIGIPGKKMHMEYRVGKKHFDYFPLKRVFWEHHPILRKLGRDINEYAEERREILDTNGYERIPLIVSDTMFKDIEEITSAMRRAEVDFRTGSVPDRLVIIKENVEEETVLELLMEPLFF